MNKSIPFLILAASALGCGGSSSEQSEETAADFETSTETAGDETTPVVAVQAAGPMGIEAPPDVAAAPADAMTTPSGLASKVLLEGTGARHPAASDSVTVHYVGWTTDGERFDSSIERGEPATFPLNRVIAGWTEGVQLMVVGERRRLWIPEDLAYQGRPGSPGGMLVFDVELLEIGE